MAKLMLVEDDNNLREIYEARLQAEGYAVVSARDGEEALVVAKAEKPDLIISDVMMPKISGFEMLDILRNTEELKHVKVIMLTALGQSDDQQRADRLGADRYLVKSQVTLEDIVKVAHELLGDGGEEAGASSQAPAAVPAPIADPVAEPPAAPSEPTPPPIAVAEPPVDPAAPVAQSTAQEEADVEAQIEDFVAGASSKPTLPAEPPADDSQSETFVAGADPAQAEPVASTPVPEPAVPANPPTEPNDESTGSSVPIANKKVIKPLDNQDKKDIHTLLALEEVAEKAKQGPPPPTAIIATDQDGSAAVPLAVPPKIGTANSGNAGTPTKADDAPDPNSIAL